MRVAIVYPKTLEPPHLFKDMGLLVEGFRALGHEAILICPETEAGNTVWPSYVITDRELEDSERWAQRKIDLAIVYTWLGYFPEVVAALKAAGVYTISKGDTDGLIGYRVHPYPVFVRRTFSPPSLLMKARNTVTWLIRYACLYREVDELVLHNLQQADFTIVETEAAKSALRRFLAYFGFAQLESKVKVVPNPVAEPILALPLAPAKRNKVVAIGRWEDPQKDVTLLVHALTLFLRQFPERNVTVIGSGGEEYFAPLVRQFPSFRYVGAIPHEQIAEHLVEAQVCLFTSRWEGSPIAGNEALALGCSVVGPDLPALRSICEAGPFGTLARNRRPQSIAAALEEEMAAWVSGERNAQDIAAYWRPRLSSANVVRQILALAER